MQGKPYYILKIYFRSCSLHLQALIQTHPVGAGHQRVAPDPDNPKFWSPDSWSVAVPKSDLLRLPSGGRVEGRHGNQPEVARGQPSSLAQGRLFRLRTKKNICGKFCFPRVNFTNLLREQIPIAQKDSQVKQLFALSGSIRAKAACKHVGEIDPWSFYFHW